MPTPTTTISHQPSQTKLNNATSDYTTRQHTKLHLTNHSITPNHIIAYHTIHTTPNLKHTTPRPPRHIKLHQPKPHQTKPRHTIQNCTTTHQTKPHQPHTTKPNQGKPHETSNNTTTPTLYHTKPRQTTPHQNMSCNERRL